MKSEKDNLRLKWQYINTKQLFEVTKIIEKDSLAKVPLIMNKDMELTSNN